MKIVSYATTHLQTLAGLVFSRAPFALVAYRALRKALREAAPVLSAGPGLYSLLRVCRSHSFPACDPS